MRGSWYIMNHIATHKADSHKREHTATQDFINTHTHTHIKRAMGRPWGEGRHGFCGSRSVDDSVLMKTQPNIFICFPTTK